ncbi:M50 family metallopeptidase [Peribacillus loiseleuriae]|uniref:Stage IV sporulation protein FB n=1 Tax=Peribacillus loiseleuriae TaxID=1679170 RepID=A0A0K9GXX2_9BACI|nr:M50 family metallopeptidase [Peribacillus loiseleuriae]KMY51097.1 stage IV sporulation protein FB [Peribacillus loiseleuriae]
MNELLKLLWKIKIHPTLWLVIGISVLTSHFTQILMFFVIIFVHEMGHAVAAHFFKWRIKSIQLLPFGGALETDEYGNKSLKEDLIVILAGPIQHVWLVGLAYLFYSFSIMPYEMYQQFFYSNAAVMLFNLLPVWPLDGGKLLFLGLSKHKSYLDAHSFTLLISSFLAAAGFGLSVLLISFNLNVWIIACFIGISLAMEWRQRYYAFIRFLLDRHYGRSEDLTRLEPIQVDENEMIYKVLEKFQRGCKHPVIVMKNGQESGSLDENELLHAYFTNKMTNGKIGELLYAY